MIRLRDLVRSHFTGREGGMTTVWRPRVRIPVPDIDGADADENRRDESTTKGTKRKRAPKHHGPCEHGVKPRSKCKVCGACPHGRRRSSARSAVVHQYVSMVVGALIARSVVGHRYASTVVSANTARSAVGQEYASTVVSALSARSAVGLKSASTVVSATSARSAVVQEYASTVVSAYLQGVRWVMQYASTVVGALSARSAVGHAICEHGRQRSYCKECGGSGICEHGRVRSRCKECHTAKQ